MVSDESNNAINRESKTMTCFFYFLFKSQIIHSLNKTFQCLYYDRVQLNPEVHNFQ